MSRLVAAILALFLGIAAVAAAEPPLQPEEAFALTAERSADGLLELNWAIAEGYYLYEDRFGVADAEGDVPFRSGQAKVIDDPYFGETGIYHDRATLTLQRDVVGDLTASFQGCQEGGICYMPLSLQIDPETLVVRSADRSAPALAGSPWSMPAEQPLASASPIASAPAGDGTTSATASTDLVQFQPDNLVAELLGAGGTFWMLAGFVLFGLLLSLTPCVFPMYPVVAGALSREGETLTAARGFGLSTTYVVFLALAFGLVGAIAGWTGQNMQMALQSPITIGVTATIFVVLALSMFGLFELSLPSAWTTRITKATTGSSASYRSMAVLGFSSALIIGPCVTAPLAGALIYIAQTGDWMLGAAALFALGIGKGVPLILLATLGSGYLPRAGAWMENTKLIFGFAFLATAILVATPLVPMGVDLALWAGLLILVSVYLFSVVKPGWQHNLQLATRATGLGAGLYAVILAVGAASGGVDPLQPLVHLTARGAAAPTAAPVFAEADGAAALDAALVSSTQAARPKLVYFTADWCISCRVIERSSLPDPDVQAALSGFDLIKVDLTRPDAEQMAMMKRLAVVGPPSMLFYDERETSQPQARLVGEIDAAAIRQAALSVTN